MDPTMSMRRLRVLLVPDSVQWVTGTIARSIVRYNPWIEGTVISGPVIDQILPAHPGLMDSFDLVHFICPYASRDWLPRFRDRLPCVTSHHHVTDWESIKHNLDGDAIMVVSRQWEDDLRDRGGPIDRVVYMPCGVDADWFRPASKAERRKIRSTLGIPAAATVIGFFAKKSSDDDDRKGTDVFVRGLLGVRQHVPDLTALIVGPGWLDLVRSLRSAGIRCLWFPFILRNRDLKRMYSALDFYWVTARVEGGPIPLLEAMSSGVCCVTTPVGLARELVVDRVNAALVPMNDPDSFVERTRELISQPAERQRLSRGARETILDRMHVARTTQKAAELYALAFRAYAARCSISAALDVRALALEAPAVGPAGEEVPRCGLPPSLRARARMLENLAWSDSLILQGQHGIAVRMIAQEWLRQPLAAEPRWLLMRRYLPRRLTEQISSLKRRNRNRVSSPSSDAAPLVGPSEG
jgi:glycosyltransferase involved in cell wall biosynthesis